MATPKSPAASIKIVILGGPGVGKSSILDQYVNHKYTNVYKATVGTDVMSKNVIIDNRSVTVQIWDSCGQERFQSLGVAYYRGADCCILVYDVTQPKSFQELGMWKDEFLIQGAPTNAQDFPFVLLGNKIDLVENRMITARKAKAWCEQNNDMPYFEVSAKEAVNIDKAFDTILRCALKREEAYAELYNEIAINSFSLDVAPRFAKKAYSCRC